jgi:HlyD family secretion protein
VPNAALRWRPAGAAETRAPADVPAQKGGGQAMQEFRARIVEDLKLSEAQKARLEDIFNESRQKFARVSDVQSSTERRRQAERIRAETNSRIAELLTPEQKPAWERLLSEFGARGQAASGRVYVPDAGQPKAVEVRLGLTDGSSTELLGGALAEGAEVIIGTTDNRTSGQTAPSGGLRPRLF